MRHCRHESPKPGCGVCRRYDSDPAFRAFSDRTAAKLSASPPPAACRRLGEELTGPERAARGLDHARRWSLCLHPDRPLGEAVCGCKGCGPKCPGYAAGPHDPVSAPFARLDLPPGHFNASLHEYGGRLLLASRVGWAGSRLYLTELSDDLRPTGPPRELKLPHPRCAGGREDPRLFTHAGKLHLSFTGVERAGKETLTHVLVAEFGDDLRPVRVWAPQYERRTYPREKNWTAFTGAAGELLAVYSVEPHVVVRADGAHAEEVARTSAGLSWDWGHLRGGASPVLHAGEWWHWFHGMRPGGAGRRAVYTLGLYTFSPEPPYRVLRFAPEPFVVPPADEPNAHDPRACPVFPCGAVLRGGEWLVSAGWMDREVRVYRLALAAAEGRLSPVRGVPSDG